MRIEIRELTKSYNLNWVLNNVSITLETGHIYCLMGASGSGKTTLLRILLGLESADSGTIDSPTAAIKNIRLTAVFQEDRLCENFSPLDNILLAADRSLTKNMAFNELCKILPEESISRPVHTLSGGMKRRIAICRALLLPSDGIVMDEPFTGLDEQTKQHVIEYIKERASGKFLLISTHQEEDMALLGGQLLTLTSVGTTPEF